MITIIAPRILKRLLKEREDRKDTTSVRSILAVAQATAEKREKKWGVEREKKLVFIPILLPLFSSAEPERHL